MTHLVHTRMPDSPLMVDSSSIPKRNYRDLNRQIFSASLFLPVCGSMALDRAKKDDVRDNGYSKNDCPKNQPTMFYRHFSHPALLVSRYSQH